MITASDRRSNNLVNLKYYLRLLQHLEAQIIALLHKINFEDLEEVNQTIFIRSNKDCFDRYH